MVYSALIAVFFYPTFQIPFSNNLNNIMAEKIFIFSVLALISSLFYFLSISFLGYVYTPNNKITKILFILIPVVIILSIIFNKEGISIFLKDSFNLDAAANLIALSFFVYVISLSSYLIPKITWLLFALANFLITIPAIIAIILNRLNLTESAGYFIKFINSWDAVAAASALIVILTLIYTETIAFNKTQKIIGNIIIILHLILTLCIFMPETWYALALASLSILFINRENLKKDFCKRSSFYVFCISLILSLVLTFSVPISQKIETYMVNFSKIDSNFVKPLLSTSLFIDWQSLKSGNFLGEGPGKFYKLWRTYKPQDVINSTFWDTEFINSYSAMTTYFGNLGIVGVLAILFIIISILKAVKEKFKSKTWNLKELEDDEKFYILAGITSFIFSIAMLFFFRNTVIATLLFVSATGLLLGRTITWQLKKDYSNKIATIVSFILLVILFLAFIINLNRWKAVLIYNSSITQFQINRDFVKLENSLIRATEISGDDVLYRQLSAFYVQRAKDILNNATSTATTQAQENFVSVANKAIQAARSAISVNKFNYQNYLSLGIAHELQTIIDKETSYIYAREAYMNAQNLYPKNPYIPLILARLEWTTKQNATSTMSRINESLKIKQNYSLAYYLLSQLAIQNNDTVAAKQYTLQTIAADPTDINAYLQYGLLSLNEKNYSEAEQAFTAVLKLDNGNVNAMYNLTLIYILNKNYDMAQQLINTLVIKLPDSKEVINLQNYLNQIKNPAPVTNKKPIIKTTIKKK